MQNPPTRLRKLSDLQCGQSGTLTQIAHDYSQKTYLEELGFTENCRIEIVRKAPLGDPLHVRVRQSEFVLRSSDAEHLTILLNAN